MAVIMLAAYALCSGGRTLIAQILVTIIFTFIIYKKQLFMMVKDLSARKKIRKFRKHIIIAVLLIVVSMVLLTIQRKGTASSRNMTAWRSMYEYTGYILPYLDVQLSNYHYPHLHGYAFILGFIRLSQTVICNLLKLPQPDAFYVLTKDIAATIQLGTYVSSDDIMNAYVTMFYYFYADGGIVGVILESFVFGLLVSGFYYRLRKNIDIKIVSIYMIIIMILILSFTDNPMNYGYLHGILLIMLVFKRRGKEKPGRVPRIKKQQPVDG